MAQPLSLDPSAFLSEGGRLGLPTRPRFHRFSHRNARLVGEYLNQRGITVVRACLPGHATTLDDFELASLE